MPEIDKLTIGQIRQEQKDDRWCRHMYCHLKDNTLPADALEAASISAAAPHYVIDPELRVLMRHDPGGPEKEALPEGISDRADRVFLPPSLRATVIEYTHCVAPGAHPKGNKLLRLCSHYYYWPNMSADIKK